MSDSTDYILYDTPADHVARITLNRPDQLNSQDTHLLYALNEAFDRAAHDDNIKVIILAGKGKHFSAGHDLRERDYPAQMAKHKTVHPVCGFSCAGVEAQMAREEEIYLGFSERWRNIPKVTIASVQGQCIAGGLMLVWPCDLIIAAENAKFSDPVVALGVGGVEYFTHVWEIGTRKAKEMLFTGDTFTAEQAREWGMVNHVVPLDQLEDETLKLAKRIATKPAFALKMTKKAVNSCVDAGGREVAMQNAFHLHQLAHAHNLKQFDQLIDPSGLPPALRDLPPVKG